MANDITSANAVFIISVPGILPVPQALQGFGTDDIFDVDDVDAADTMMSVDGILFGGMIFAVKPMNVTLMAASPSVSFFDAWYAASQANTTAYTAQATITFTALGTTFGLLNGYLKRYKPMPDAKRVLQPRKFRIEWQSILTAPVGPAG